ncbi:MAG: Eco57I restriction-modification methylase domain-containing protein, partial [candidate division WOR-3 bacterium]
EEGFMLPEAVRCRIAQTLNLEPRMVTYPRWFDVIVGNPPYTRQEEIPAIGVDKGKLIEDALKLGNRKIADISRRAGIHAYFFVHGTKFLKEGGRFGFIVSNSWLDVDYGKGLQEFFLQNYKIVAIIESKVEPWFKDADINTCIVILEKCSSKKERDNNRVRFVYLKKQLREFVPPAQDIWEKQLERLRVIDALIQTIIAHDRFYENEELRIYPKLQSELWAEGYDAQEGKYAGSKWGKYLRAPQIFFKILEKGKGKLVPLKELAEVRFGIKTGANEFFYLTEEQIKRWGIERRFLKPIIFSLKEVRGYKLNKSSLRKKVIICHKTKNKLKGTNLLKYILWGERRGYNRRPTCAARGDNTWYYLGHNWDYAPLIFPAKIGERMPVFLNYGIFEDKKLYGVTPKRRRDILLIGALLNSTLARFFIEYASRQLTGSQAIADIDVIVVESLLIPHSKNFAQKSRVRLIAAFKKLLKRDALSIFDELGAKSADEVALDKVKPDRRELDKIIMGDILGLTEEEQLEVYRAVVDLVRARLEKAKGVKKGRRKQGFDIQALKAAVIKELEGLEE